MHCHPDPPRHRDSIQRSPLAIAILCFGGLLGTGMVAQERYVEPAAAVDARALDTAPRSRVEGGGAMDAALAAALVGAISEQFGYGIPVAVQLGRVAVAPVSLRDREISGEGRLRIGDDRDWIPFRFRALYDTAGTSVGRPDLVLGLQGAPDPVASDSRLSRDLAARVERELAREFTQQPVDLSIDRITAVPAAGRYLAVRAQGTAAFEGEGRAPARVRGLYDRRSGRWLRVDYEL